MGDAIQTSATPVPGHVGADREIGLGSVWFTAPADLDPVTASEMLAELADLTSMG